MKRKEINRIGKGGSVFYRSSKRADRIKWLYLSIASGIVSLYCSIHLMK